VKKRGGHVEEAAFCDDYMRGLLMCDSLALKKRRQAAPDRPFPCIQEGSQ